MRIPKQVAVAAVTAGVGVLALLSCVTQPPRASSGLTQVAIAKGVNRDRPECPYVWEFAVETGTSQSVVDRESLIQPVHPLPLATSGQAALSGPLTDIPEFNDCQRFIVNGQYDALYAIFVPAATELLYQEDFPTTGPNEDIVRRGVPVATIFSMGGTYASLGIEPGFSCLYVSRASPERLQAAMASELRGECDDRKAARFVRPLRVERTAFPGTTRSDYPLAARWEMDPSGRYVAGVPCGAAWCEIGEDPSGLSRGYMFAADRADALRFRIKGWHDEQVLAMRVPNPGLPSDSIVVPSNVSGIVVPAGNLIDYVETDFRGQFQHVATIFLRRSSSVYKEKLNARGPNFNADNPVGPGNRVFLCLDGPRRCPVPDSLRRVRARNSSSVTSPRDSASWWAMVVSARSEGDFKPVVRCDHSDVKPAYGFGVAATARWRWVADDETLWVRCLEGCCEVHPWEE